MTFISKGKIIYAFGCIILFLGLLWTFLPHVAHEAISHDEGSHLIHTSQGILTVLIVTAILIIDEKIKKKRKQ